MESNQLNGKYGIDDNGMVGNISLADFEKKIIDESSPKTNFTQLISNEAQSYHYCKDRDIIQWHRFIAIDEDTLRP